MALPGLSGGPPLRTARVLGRVLLPVPWHWDLLDEEPDFALYGPPPGGDEPGGGGELRVVWLPGAAAGTDAGAHAAAVEALAQGVRAALGPDAQVERLPDGGAFGARAPADPSEPRFWVRSLPGDRRGAGIVAAALAGGGEALADALGRALRGARG